MSKTYSHIEGRQPQANELFFEKPCPASGGQGMPVRETSEAEVTATIIGAKEAFRDYWSRLIPDKRREALIGLADLIDENAEQFAALDSQEMGKPLHIARGEVGVASALFRYYAGAIDKLYGDVSPSTPFSHELQVLVPRGVVAALTPWNFPTINAALKAAPALASGNTVILKPSPFASASTVLMAGLACKCEMPPGVLSVITGSTNISKFLVSQEGLDFISFTGSTETGAKVMSSASAHVTPVALECGGKSPSIVFQDAVTDDRQIENLAKLIADEALWNSGQVCVARNRVYIERPIYDSLLEALVETCRSRKVGLPTDPLTDIGPLANKQQIENVSNAIGRAKSSSARIVLDGSKIKGFSEFFIGPVVIQSANQSDWVTQNEIFGPVISTIPFDRTEDAVRMANDSKYGLAGTVYTSNFSRAHQMADSIDVGKLTITTGQASGQSSWQAQSAEPAKSSGFGVEGGLEGMRSYMRKKLIEFRHG
jgi:acyl-CoA reductase-like NAD-dependent aldehyde dehydrogenase